MFDYKPFYKRIASRLPNDSCIVEVGAWQGTSALFLADEIRRLSKRSRFYVVDDFSATKEPDIHRNNLLNNISRCNLQEFIEVIGKPSVEAATMFEERCFDFVYIDATHTYDAVRSDVASWISKVKRGGIFAGHDYYRKEKRGLEVKMAVQTHIPSRALHGEPTRLGNGVWWCRRDLPDDGCFSREFEEIPDDYLIYIPYIENPRLLKRAIGSLAIHHLKKVLVIDMSGGDISPEIPDVAVYRWRSDPLLDFARMHNFLQTLACLYGIQYLIFQRSDCELLTDVVTELINGRPPGAGAIFANYDALCLFDAASLRRVGCWDESLVWRTSNIEYYRRLQRESAVQDLKLEDLVVHNGPRYLTGEIRAEKESGSDLIWDEYIRKWGGKPDQEVYRIPYDGKP